MATACHTKRVLTCVIGLKLDLTVSRGLESSAVPTAGEAMQVELPDPGSRVLKNHLC